MIRIAFVSVGRSDWGGLSSVIEACQSSEKIDVKLIVYGDHDTQHYPKYRVESHNEKIKNVDYSALMGELVTNFGKAYLDLKPDLLVLLGDRFETLCAATASITMGIPLAHLHGGEVTVGAIDDSIRHALTKLSHIHLTSTVSAEQRVLQMGEEPWRVFKVGSPSLDTLARAPRFAREEFCENFHLDPNEEFVLATLHPETISTMSFEQQISCLVGALEELNISVLFTAPNQDPGHEVFRGRISEAIERNSKWRFVESLGSKNYFSALMHASVMVGNSSSGIIEAMSAELPVVNIGDRQAGRDRGPNVEDVPWAREEIATRVRLSMRSEAKERLKGMPNPYGDGSAGIRIAKILSTLPERKALLTKEFMKLI